MQTYVLYTDIELDEFDIVIINEEEYKVVKVDVFKNVLPHCEIYVAKI